MTAMKSESTALSEAPADKNQEIMPRYTQPIAFTSKPELKPSSLVFLVNEIKNKRVTNSVFVIQLTQERVSMHL
jgi:hypothetical protein